MKHNPGFDGLRGLAVICVIVFHSRAPYLQGGFLGVDIFFVLSGYLITSLLVEEFRGKHDISFKNFYMRRTIRLMPALLALLVPFSLMSMLVFENPLSKANLMDTCFALFYLTSWTRAFDINPPNFFLGHTWSLSIEEQFYLVWPPLLFIMLKTIRSLKAVMCIVLMSIAAVHVMRYTSIQNQMSINRIYNGFDMRLDGLLMGCLTGLLLIDREIRSIIMKTNFNFLALGIASLCTILVLMSFALWTRYQTYTLIIPLTQLLTSFIIISLVVQQEQHETSF